MSEKQISAGPRVNRVIYITSLAACLTFGGSPSPLFLSLSFLPSSNILKRSKVALFQPPVPIANGSPSAPCRGAGRRVQRRSASTVWHPLWRCVPLKILPAPPRSRVHRESAPGPGGVVMHALECRISRQEKEPSAKSRARYWRRLLSLAFSIAVIKNAPRDGASLLAAAASRSRGGTSGHEQSGRFF